MRPDGDVGDEEVAQTPEQVEHHSPCGEHDGSHPDDPRRRVPAAKPVALDGGTGDRRLSGEQCARGTQPDTGSGARRHGTGAAEADGLHDVEPDEAQHAERVGGGEPEPDAHGAADVGLRRGEPERTDVRGQCSGDGEQRHHDHHREQDAAAAGHADAEVDAPRQQQRDDEQCDREPVARPVGAGWDVADPSRRCRGGHGRGRHLGRRGVLVFAHVTSPLRGC